MNHSETNGATDANNKRNRAFLGDCIHLITGGKSREFGYSYGTLGSEVVGIWQAAQSRPRLLKALERVSGDTIEMPRNLTDAIDSLLTITSDEALSAYDKGTRREFLLSFITQAENDPQEAYGYGEYGAELEFKYQREAVVRFMKHLCRWLLDELNPSDEVTAMPEPKPEPAMVKPKVSPEMTDEEALNTATIFPVGQVVFRGECYWIRQSETPPRPLMNIEDRDRIYRLMERQGGSRTLKGCNIYNSAKELWTALKGEGATHWQTANSGGSNRRPIGQSLRRVSWPADSNTSDPLRRPLSDHQRGRIAANKNGEKKASDETRRPLSDHQRGRIAA